METAMKKHILVAAIVGAFATGVVTTSFAQDSQGGAGAGSVSGSKSDNSGANPSNNGTTAGTTGSGSSGR